jgi:thioredoxin 1
MAHPVAVSDETFEREVVESPTPVLVDFWAEWCGPCKMITPVLEQIAEEQDAKLKIVKLNVDENPSMLQKFGIRGIPTMILFKGGQPVETIVGFMPKPALMGKLEKHIS